MSNWRQSDRETVAEQFRQKLFYVPAPQVSTRSRIKSLLYGDPETAYENRRNAAAAESIYRLERGTPYYAQNSPTNANTKTFTPILGGLRLRPAVPQFRALTIFSPTANNNILPGAQTTTVNKIAWPSKVK